ncbi:carboxy-S-adenosyl-L-methionine synthase CmoA [Bacteriovorax sp. Seq25_V]|uniref:carboxy-S-adenosyl-L-methionine synthase CmoA n=1 Tax=Bacteriovorax sp. Seq25_V TaxID=1201288 RepID=UPI00038A1A92|nr:carboxy-S-adenosyl-L-methionine synthase CmoA [Bacteriovorax sp. Seq25_V]EQC45527.1 tRNA (cmo5U34)-methyltransferase [Bacteriovorax sp. Seq25_V]
MRDEVFKKHRDEISKFEFNDDVAQVFDDMVERSIPNYHEIHKIIADLCRRAYLGGNIYDLGCSTGSTLQIIAQAFKKMEKDRPAMFGVDNSVAMIDKARKKLDSFGLKDINLSNGDIETFPMENAGMVIMNYTLQFLEPSSRPEILKNIFDSLNPGGVFVLAEKIICHDDQIDKLLIDLYYDFKRRNGYSEMEISQKRDALENVLRPITPTDQIQMMKEAGFKKTEMIFRWYNFCCYLGIK